MSLVFNSKEEKEAALNAIQTDAPVGVNIDEWERETEAKIDEIMSAEIKETADDEPSEDQIPEKNEPNHQNTLPQEPQQPSNSDHLDELERLRKNNEYLQQRADSATRETEEKISDMLKQIEELKKGNSAAPQKDKPSTETEHEILAVRQEIINLEKAMNEESDDEYEDTVKTLKNLKKQGQLQLRLSALQEKRAEDLIKKQEAEIMALKADQNLRKKRIEAEELEMKRNKAVEKFRESIPELKGGKKFEEMMDEYNVFAIEVASAYLNIPADKVIQKDCEVAMARYLEGSEILERTLAARGIKEPEELRKFIILSEVDALRQGYVVDKLTGEYVQMKDATGNPVNFPNHDAAYAYLQRENGDYAKNILKVQERTQRNMMHAMTRREPIELTEDEHRNSNIDSMTSARAMEIIEKYDPSTIVLRARKNMKDPLFLEYNKALSKLGHAVITEEDL